jgi:hypothetical protein
VRGRLAVEVVTLDAPGEAPPFGRADNVHAIPDGEHVSGKALAFLHVSFLYTKFTQVLDCRQVALLKVSALAAGQPVGGNFLKAQLHGGVAIVFSSADLRYKAWASLDDGDRRYSAVRVKDLAHADFLANYALHGTSTGLHYGTEPFGAQVGSAPRIIPEKLS